METATAMFALFAAIARPESTTERQVATDAKDFSVEASERITRIRVGEFHSSLALKINFS